MNNRREDLLARLDDPDTSWEELGPILDELDAREGAVPFDTQAGWADLMARIPKKRKLFGKLPLAAVHPTTKSGTALSLGQDILSVNGNTITGVLHTFGFQSVLTPGKVAAKFEDLGYWEGETFVPLLDGTWHLYWKLDSVALGTTFPLDHPIQVAAGEATAANLTISPVSVRLEVVGAEIDTDTLYLEFADGSQQKFPGENSRSWGCLQNQWAYTTRVYAMFESAIDPNQVTAVIIEDNRIPIP